jgi:hypothetical protein
MTQLRFIPSDIERLKATAVEMTKAGWPEQTICRAMANSVGMAWEDFEMPERDYALALIRGTLTL